MLVNMYKYHVKLKFFITLKTMILKRNSTREEWRCRGSYTIERTNFPSNPFNLLLFSN